MLGLLWFRVLRCWGSCGLGFLGLRVLSRSKETTGGEFRV